MNRREFLINSYRIGGLAALWSLGVSRLEASSLIGSGITTAGSDGFVGLDGTPDFTNSSVTNGVNQVGYSDAFEALVSGPIGHIHLYFTAATTTAYNAAIYSADGATKLADSSSTSPSGAGYLAFALDSTIEIVSGTSYILAVGQVDTAGTSQSIGFSSVAGSTRNRYVVATVTSTDMPSTMQGTGTSTSNQAINIYADNTP